MESPNLKKFISILQRDAEFHRVEKFSEIGFDFDEVDASIDAQDPIRGIPFAFWDAWIDERNHNFPGHYKGIEKADWPILAEMIVVSLKNNIAIEEPKLLKNFDFRR